jgi:hypothetical protein
VYMELSEKMCWRMDKNVWENVSNEETRDRKPNNWTDTIGKSTKRKRSNSVNMRQNLVQNCPATLEENEKI